MKTVRRRPSVPACVAAFGCLWIVAPAASAASSPATTSPSAAPPPTTTPPPPAPTPAPAAPRLLLSLQRVGGKPPFALVGARMVLRGVVWHYVAEQAVKVSIYREGRKVKIIRVPVAAVGN